MKIYAILGGSGSGKSTVTYAILDQYPELFSTLHLDDFLIKRNSLLHNGVINFDHPHATDFDDLYILTERLKAGQSIQIRTWDKRLNPDHEKTGKKSLVTIEPKENLIIEGFLPLHDERIRRLVDQSFFLDLNEETRLKRRKKPINDDQYIQNILIPMHNQYVEPQKEYASHIIDVSQKTVDDVKDFILSKINLV